MPPGERVGSGDETKPPLCAIISPEPYDLWTQDLLDAAKIKFIRVCKSIMTQCPITQGSLLMLVQMLIGDN